MKGIFYSFFKVLGVLFFLMLSNIILMGQRNDALPRAYLVLNTDKDRLLFLERAIRDSLDGGQLTNVSTWSRLGLQLARKNHIDTLTGIFLYDVAKAFTYHEMKFDSAIFYYKQVFSYFPNINRKYHIFSIREIMERYADLGNKDSSFAYLRKLVSYIDTMPKTSPKRISLSLNIATVYQYFGLYQTAIYYFNNAIIGNRKNGNYSGLGLALANLGSLYNEMGDDEKAIRYSKEALLYLSDIKMPYAQTSSNIADFYIALRRYDSAGLYLKESNRIATEINLRETKQVNQVLQAKIYIHEKKYDLSRRLLDSSLKQLEGNAWQTCRILLCYVELDTLTQTTQKALQRVQALADISKKNNFSVFFLIAQEQLASIYAKLGDHRLAYATQASFMHTKDSITNEKTKMNLNDLEIKYNALQKDQKIRMLQSQNTVNSLSYQNSKRQLIMYLLVAIITTSVLAITLYQRNIRNTIQTQKLKAELQTQILRSQMNPHFIFNCLNSIENFIMQNNKRSASDYLNKFSLLIRTILDSSRNEVVPIIRDIEALSLYMELEQLRFSNKFNTNVSVDEALLGGDYRVPSLLIQPFVENAIIHGLAPSERNDLTLTVSVSLKNEFIHYIIHDNGIGREQSNAYNKQNRPYHTSVGLKISEDRIRMFNKNKIQNPLKIIDIYDDQGQPCGTRVEISIQAV